jgi:hypothetical protein
LKDKWLGRETLSTRFSRFFELSVDHNISVVVISGCRDGKWEVLDGVGGEVYLHGRVNHVLSVVLFLITFYCILMYQTNGFDNLSLTQVIQSMKFNTFLLILTSQIQRWLNRKLFVIK